MRIQRKKTAQGRGGSAGQGMAEGAKGTEGKSKTGQDRARQGKTMQRAGQRDPAEGKGSVAKETTMYWMAGSNASSNSRVNFIIPWLHKSVRPKVRLLYYQYKMYNIDFIRPQNSLDTRCFWCI